MLKFIAIRISVAEWQDCLDARWHWIESSMQLFIMTFLFKSGKSFESFCHRKIGRNRIVDVGFLSTNFHGDLTYIYDKESGTQKTHSPAFMPVSLIDSNPVKCRARTKHIACI